MIKKNQSFSYLKKDFSGSFDRLYFTTNKHIEMLIQRIYSMFRMKPLDMKHLQEDTMLMRQQRHDVKNYKEEFEWLKLKMIKKETQNKRDQQFMIYGNFGTEYYTFGGEAGDI